jgi:hypothetical protein
MAAVTIMCPQTGKHVSTGMEMDRARFNALSYSRRFVFHCWLCGREHEWSKRWATLADRDPNQSPAASVARAVAE